MTECQVLFVQEHKLFLPVASHCHISQKSKNQPLFSNSTKLSCSNAAVRHKHTAQFSQSKPTSTQHFLIQLQTRAHFKRLLHASASATTQNATHRKNTLHVKPVMLVRIQNPPQKEPTSCGRLLFPEWGGICHVLDFSEVLIQLLNHQN